MEGTKTLSQVQDFVKMAVALLFIVISHEVAHGVVALWNGDDTAKRAGRLTANPLPHIDPIGLISLLLFHFGWAKPVPIDPRKFKNGRLGLLTVSLAGVTVNILTAVVALILLKFVPLEWFQFRDFLSMLALYGIAFFLFNLLPIPPLDGSKVIAAIAPPEVGRAMQKFERYGWFLMIALIATGWIGNFLSSGINTILDFLMHLIF